MQKGEIFREWCPKKQPLFPRGVCLIEFGLTLPYQGQARVRAG